MRRLIAIILLFILSVSALGQRRAPHSPRVAPNTYYMIKDRRARVKLSTPSLGAAGTSITDPDCGTTIWRVTDGTTTNPTDTNLLYTTTSAADHPTWSINSDKFYIKTLGSAVLPYRITS